MSAVFLLLAPPMPRCDPSQAPSDTLSASNAAFLVISIAMACITQPPGSLFLSRCSRFWRLYPGFSALESLVIYLHLIRTACKRESLQVTAHSLLARRLYNAKSGKGGFGVVWDCPPEGLGDHDAPVWERGILLHTVISVPMLLQALKLALARGHAATTVVGVCYLSSWVSVELLSFLARKPLDDQQCRDVRWKVGGPDFMAILLAVSFVFTDFSFWPRSWCTLIWGERFWDLWLKLDSNEVVHFTGYLGVFGMAVDIYIPEIWVFCFSRLNWCDRRYFWSYAFNWITLRTFVFFLVYYATAYNACDTHKSQWFDWLG